MSEWVLVFAEGNIMRFSQGRIDVYDFPFGSGQKLDHPFSIIFTRQHPEFVDAERVNKTVTKLTNGSKEWYGNILVLRHGIKKAVVNVRHVDLELIKLILRRWGITYLHGLLTDVVM